MHKVDKVICSKHAKILWRKKKKRIAQHLKLKNTQKNALLFKFKNTQMLKKILKTYCDKYFDVIKLN